jgi:hypothetical protein
VEAEEGSDPELADPGEGDADGAGCADTDGVHGRLSDGEGSGDADDRGSGVYDAGLPNIVEGQTVRHEEWAQKFQAIAEACERARANSTRVIKGLSLMLLDGRGARIGDRALLTGWAGPRQAFRSGTHVMQVASTGQERRRPLGSAAMVSKGDCQDAPWAGACWGQRYMPGHTPAEVLTCSG